MPALPANAARGASGCVRVRNIWGVALLVLLVLGGIYGGVFTATEGAGIGASGAFFFALARGALTPRTVFSILVESARTTAMLFTILIAAMMFANFVNFTTMPGDLKDWILGQGLPPLAIVGAMMLIYVVLGTIMEELSMVLLTIPVFFPIVVQLGFDPVWFGVLIVLVVQIGLISPPVGHEPVRAQYPAQGRAADADLSRRLALRRRPCGGADRGARVPAAGAVVARPHALGVRADALMDT